MPEDSYPSDKADRIMVRLPDGMRARLSAVAAANKRSVNAEVVARLEVSLDGDERARPIFEQMESVPENETFELVQKFVSDLSEGMKALSEKHRKIPKAQR